MAFETRDRYQQDACRVVRDLGMVLGGNGINLAESFDEILGVTVADPTWDYESNPLYYAMSIGTKYNEEWYVVETEKGFSVLWPFRFEELKESGTFPSFREAFFHALRGVLEDAITVLADKSVDQSP